MRSRHLSPCVVRSSFTPGPGLVSPVDPLIPCRCTRRQIYFPPRGDASAFPPTQPADGDFPSASPLSCPVTLELASSGSNVHTLAYLLPWQSGSAYCKSAALVRLPGSRLSTQEPIIIAAVARPSSDIKRLLNQHQLDCLWCTARQNAHIIQLFPPEYHLVSSARTRNCGNGCRRKIRNVEFVCRRRFSLLIKVWLSLGTKTTCLITFKSTYYSGMLCRCFLFPHLIVHLFK